MMMMKKKKNMMMKQNNMMMKKKMMDSHVMSEWRPQIELEVISQFLPRFDYTPVLRETDLRETDLRRRQVAK